MERHGFEPGTERAKGMEIAITDLPPVPELLAKVERRPGRAHEVAFVDTEQASQALEGGIGCLARDVGVGPWQIDEVNLAVRALQDSREHRSDGPSSRPAAD